MVEDSILIQVNATIIAGFLILLSISMVWDSTGKKIKPMTTKIRKSVFYLTPKQIFLFLFPFAISTILIILNTENNPDVSLWAGWISGLGFGILILIAGIVGFSERREELDFSNP